MAQHMPDLYHVYDPHTQRPRTRQSQAALTSAVLLWSITRVRRSTSLLCPRAAASSWLMRLRREASSTSMADTDASAARRRVSASASAHLACGAGEVRTQAGVRWPHGKEGCVDIQSTDI